MRGRLSKNGETMHQKQLCRILEEQNLRPNEGEETLCILASETTIANRAIYEPPKLSRPPTNHKIHNVQPLP